MLVKCGISKKRIIRLLVPVLFCVVLFLLFTVANNLFRPVWYDWNNYHTIHDFYEEPDNHIEVVFLGSSVVVNGFSPMQMYNEYGICSYNLGTEQQPLSASYVLLQEAYNYHAETLKVVVLDTSLLFRIPDNAFYEKAVTNLKTSKIKVKSLASETECIDNMVFSLVPFLHFHDRWDELNKNDYVDVDNEVNYTRGINISLDRLIENRDTMKELGLPAYWYDENVEPREPDADSLNDFYKIVEFCSLNDIELLLSKAPLIGWWDSAEHKAVMALANENGLPFIDCNFSPYLEELGLQFPLDYVDPYHMNYNGAQKYTHFWGSYLSKMSNIHDVRGQKDYEYMSQQLSGYKSLIRTTELDNIRDIGAYTDELLGQAPILFVVTGLGYDETAFQKWLSSRIERNKLPQKIIVVDEIPRNQMKKIDRKGLQKLWENRGSLELMNPVIDAILSRRSIRKFTDQEIPQDILDMILKCGYHAPSGHNMQSWRFTVLTKSEDIERLKQTAAVAAKRNKVVMYGFENPKVLVLVSNDNRNLDGCQDASCAAENMMLAAQSFGLGSVWINVLMKLRNEEPVKTVLDDFGVPENHTIWAAVALGWPRGEGVKLQKKTDVVKFSR